MKRTRTRRSLTPSDAEKELLWLTRGMAESASRAEDLFWDKRLNAAVDALLRSDEETILTKALDLLVATQTPERAHDVLADCIESRAECSQADEGETLLLAAPILAWSRFSIPTGKLPAPTLSALKNLLQTIVLAPGLSLNIADTLFSPDQVPQNYCDTAAMCAHLSASAGKDGIVPIDNADLPESVRFLSDVRYVLITVKTQAEAPIFRWQEPGCSRKDVFAQWIEQATPILATALPGCAIHPVLPDAYFSSCREANRESRAYSIHASCAFLCTTLELAPSELQAVIGAFYEEDEIEYRVGFAKHGSNTVLHGVVWPVFSDEEDPHDIPPQIETALKENGVKHIKTLSTRFAPEYCEDCGVPFYPSPKAEAVHAEMPEDTLEQMPKHLH